MPGWLRPCCQGCSKNLASTVFLWGGGGGLEWLDMFGPSYWGGGGGGGGGWSGLTCWALVTSAFFCCSNIYFVEFS